MDTDLVNLYDTWRKDGVYGAEAMSHDWKVTQAEELLAEPLEFMSVDKFLASSTNGCGIEEALGDDDFLRHIALVGGKWVHVE
jgi:hypothetical protein